MRPAERDTSEVACSLRVVYVADSGRPVCPFDGVSEQFFHEGQHVQQRVPGAERQIDCCARRDLPEDRLGDDADNRADVREVTGL